MKEMKYRLKRNAIEFFADKFTNSVCGIDTWEEHGVHFNALEEVRPVYVEYGIKTENGATLCGWSNDGGDHNARFEFTLKIPDTDNKHYEKLSSNTGVSGMIQVIENAVEKYVKSL